jgi:hypothetical protein
MVLTTGPISERKAAIVGKAKVVVVFKDPSGYDDTY